MIAVSTSEIDSHTTRVYILAFFWLLFIYFRAPSHTAHGLLALWYLGADADILKAAYEQESSYQRATYASPGPINKDNWTEHLGDAKYLSHSTLHFKIVSLNHNL